MNEDMLSLCNIIEVAVKNMRKGLETAPCADFSREVLDQNAKQHLLVANRALAEIHGKLLPSV